MIDTVMLKPDYLKSRQIGTAFDLPFLLLENATCRACTGCIDDGS
ncbi:hypothetical protein HU200_022277 [Digitaria exilis]|uniref:Uncharacterized protein n=1 Tax=Digitaria exilis TaxID=1010633 RepID=A0A835ASV8_9POAL|nr:hypothetical protein HU200_049513 [Digitaria exilis]KAF8723122.1 hypothetical protein HU200_022277 [Digitaria exilis]